MTRLGFAAQLVTVRAVGTFLADPAVVPEPIAASVAGQLGIGDPGLLAGYAKAPVRWKHTAEIRRRYGYRDFTSGPAHLSLLRWLYRQAWADDLSPTALFRAAHRWLLAERVVLPGENVLIRTVASERVARRLWSRLARAASPELVRRLEGLLVVPEGKRRSELDRLRRRRSAPRSGPSISGLETNAITSQSSVAVGNVAFSERRFGSCRTPSASSCQASRPTSTARRWTGSSR